MSLLTSKLLEVSPTINLNLNSSLPTAFTFSRASQGTQVQSGVLSTASTNVARFETSPAGMLLEPQNTNYIRNPLAEGVVVGSPGTLPTNWSYLFQATNTTFSVAATGTEFGMTYVDLTLAGNSSFVAGEVLRLQCEGNTQVPVSLTQVWTGSWWYRLVAGAMPAGSLFQIQQTNRNAAGSGRFDTATTVLTTDATLRRGSATSTIANALSAWADLEFQFENNVTSGAFSVTIRLYAPQLELSSFVDSNIFPPPGSPATTTRAADNLTLDLTQLPGLQTAAGYSCAIEFSLLSNSQSQVVFGMSGSGGFSNTWYLGENGSGGMAVTTIVATVGQTSATAALRAVGLTNRLALTVTPTGITFNLNGAGDITVTNAGMPTMTTLAVLRAPWGAGNYEAGHVTLVTLVPGPQSAAWRASRAY